MEKFALLKLQENPSERDRRVVSELHAALRGSGCSILFHDDSDGSLYLSVGYDEECMAAYKRRRAGRRPKKLRDSQRLTVGEVRTMLDTRTADEVAAELDVSRSTLFRRLRDKDDSARF